MNGSDFGEIIGVLFGMAFFLAIFGGLIALVIYLIKKSGEQTTETDALYRKVLQNLPQEKQMLFVMQYNSVQKNSTTAVLLTFFLGGLGAHKFYIGEVGLGVVYLVFCWTYIPGIVAFIELFTISGQVAKYNRQKIVEFATMFGGVNQNILIP